MGVCYVGGGYIGLSGALAFAGARVPTRVVDVNPAVVSAINAGQCPVPGLEAHVGTTVADVVAGGWLTATVELAGALRESWEAICIAVPTERDGQPDMSIVQTLRDACRDAGVFDRGDLVILESTVVPGTGEQWGTPDLAIAPRRDWFGNRVTLRNTPRVLGGVTPRATARARAVLDHVSTQIVVLPSHREAEIVKAMENALLFLPVAAAMEVAAAYPGVDMRAVMAAVGTHFARPTYHLPMGIGGYCIPTAPKYLRAGTTGDLPILQTAERSERQGRWRRFREMVAQWKPRILLVAGWAYKPDTTLAHASPGAELALWAQAEGIEVRVCDPGYAADARPWRRHGLPTWQPGMGCDVAVLATAHAAFREPAWVRDLLLAGSLRVILDAADVWPDTTCALARAMANPSISIRRLWTPGWDQPA